MSNDDQQTLYDIFDLEHNATGAQILARYRILRDELLAESIPYDDPQFVTLNDAYRVLSDTVKRVEYDDELKAKGLYHAVERVDERTSLSDLFEVEEIDESPKDHLISDDKQPQNQPIPPEVTRTFDREEKIRELEIYQRYAKEQSKQEARGELSQYADYPRSKNFANTSRAFGLLLVIVLASIFTFINQSVESIHQQRALSVGVVLGIIMIIMLFNIWIGQRWKTQVQKRINIAKQQLEELAPSTTNNLLASEDSEENTTTPSNFYDDEANQEQYGNE